MDAAKARGDTESWGPPSEERLLNLLLLPAPHHSPFHPVKTMKCKAVNSRIETMDQGLWSPEVFSETVNNDYKCIRINNSYTLQLQNSREKRCAFF